jgi:hypothetical protein
MSQLDSRLKTAEGKLDKISHTVLAAKVILAVVGVLVTALMGYL